MTEPLYVYWCPICECQTGRLWHTSKKGPPLIPQLDEEHTCVRIEVIPKNDAEREFLDASIAVWQEIDRLSAQPGGYKGLPPSDDLRIRERAAWNAYRDINGLGCSCPAGSYNPGAVHEPYCRLA